MNITANGFLNKDFQHELNALIEGNSWITKMLKIELTETSSIDDVDVVHVSSSQRKLFVSQYIYEFILASVPIIKTYDCDDDQPRPCDDSTLEKLDSNQDTEASNPLWDQLQNFKDN